MKEREVTRNREQEQRGTKVIEQEQEHMKYPCCRRLVNRHKA